MLVNMLECGDVVPGVYDEYPEPIAAATTIEAEVARICRTQRRGGLRRGDGGHPQPPVHRHERLWATR